MKNILKSVMHVDLAKLLQESKKIKLQIKELREKIKEYNKATMSAKQLNNLKQFNKKRKNSLK